MSDLSSPGSIERFEYYAEKMSFTCYRCLFSAKIDIIIVGCNDVEYGGIAK
jgi:hypothetical protein